MSDERERTDQPLPGSVSDQNGEEAEPGHGGGEHVRHRGTGSGDKKSDEEKSGGESGEGSQSTGHPDSAG
jgi:hypothetical protein